MKWLGQLTCNLRTLPPGLSIKREYLGSTEYKGSYYELHTWHCLIVKPYCMCSRTFHGSDTSNIHYLAV